MELVFRLRFERVFVARAVGPFASLFICQRFSLLHFPIRTKALFDNIQSYSVLDFPSTKPALNSKRRTTVENLQRVRHLASLRWAKFIDELESGHIDSSGLFWFSFSHWFYRGVSKGSVGGQLTGGQCFVETLLLDSDSVVQDSNLIDLTATVRILRSKFRSNTPFLKLLTVCFGVVYR